MSIANLVTTMRSLSDVSDLHSWLSSVEMAMSEVFQTDQLTQIYLAETRFLTSNIRHQYDGGTEPDPTAFAEMVARVDAQAAKFASLPS